MSDDFTPREDHPRREPVAVAEPEHRFEPIAVLERWWLRIGMVMLIGFCALVLFDTTSNLKRVSHGGNTINPDKVMSTKPFDKPGTFKNPDGSYDAVVVAYTFGFMPKNDLVVPEDTPVHFKVASSDVVHGYLIPGHSNVNLEVVPGHVSEVTQTFDEPGRYLILCSEYCGSGHHFMTSHIRVLKKGEDPMDPPPLDGTPDANAAAATAAIDAALKRHDASAGGNA